MTQTPLRYEPYETSATVPNVVVDGSPNASTMLTLTHWPGFPAPPGLAADLSAQMAFRYASSPESRHDAAQVVTNNHFDQDGLIGVYALTQPEGALAQRTLLEDVAAAGDFATYQDRRAARLSMLIAAYADPASSPLAPLPTDHAEACATLYTELLGRLPGLVDRLDAHRNLWEDEDHELSVSEAAIASGAVTITEHPDLDLAIVTLDDTTPESGGHRFAGRRFEGVHPMALHNATDRFAILLIRGRRYRFTYRYETWVQYQSRRPRPRVDLAPLVDQLDALETGATTWHADPVGELTPQLRTADHADSSIAPEQIIARLRHHLAAASPAWDPYRATGTAPG